MFLRSTTYGKGEERARRSAERPKSEDSTVISALAISGFESLREHCISLLERTVKTAHGIYHNQEWNPLEI